MTVTVYAQGAADMQLTETAKRQLAELSPDELRVFTVLLAHIAKQRKLQPAQVANAADVAQALAQLKGRRITVGSAVPVRSVVADVLAGKVKPRVTPVAAKPRPAVKPAAATPALTGLAAEMAASWARGTGKPAAKCPYVAAVAAPKSAQRPSGPAFSSLPANDPDRLAWFADKQSK